MLWPHVKAIVIADEAERSRSLFEISKSFYEQMDEGIKPVGRYITKRELVFENPSHVTRGTDPGLRSRIVVDSAHKKNVAIGADWSVAHLSEAARYRDPGLVLDGIIPAVHRVPGTLIIIESSAEMSGTWFRDFCEQSARGRNAFEFCFVPWNRHPEYSICPVCRKTFPSVCANRDHERKGMSKLDLTGDERHLIAEFGLRAGNIVWMREKIAELGNDWDLFRQSFPLTPDMAWITPGVQVFPYEKLRAQKANVRGHKRRCVILPGPRVLDNPTGRLLIWKEPEPGKMYDLAADVASGLGKDDETSEDDLDSSVMCVVERGTCEQVAEWSSRAMDPIDFASQAYWLGMYYNTAQVAIEVNGGYGAASNAQLAKMSYPNIFLWKYRDEIVPRYSKKTGWETSPRSKPWLVSFAVSELLNDRVIIRSEALLREMSVYARKPDGDCGAIAGEHDDRVVAWMIAILISDDENFERYYSLQKELRPAKEPVKEQGRIPDSWECDRDFLLKKKDDMLKPWD